MERLEAYPIVSVEHGHIDGVTQRQYILNHLEYYCPLTELSKKLLRPSKLRSSHAMRNYIWIGPAAHMKDYYMKKEEDT